MLGGKDFRMIFGSDVRINDQAMFRYPHVVSFGNHVAVDEYVVCSTGIKAGSYIHISPLTSIIGGVNSCLTIDDFVLISTGCRIVCASDDFYGTKLIGPIVPKEFRNEPICAGVRLCSHCCICANSVILQGVTVGEGAIVGANSLVKEDVEPWTVVGGSPVRFIKKREHREEICEFGEKVLRQ